MKKISVIFAALAAFCSCQKNNEPVIESIKTFTLTAEGGFDATKAHFGVLTDNKYPMVWDALDTAAIFEFIGTEKTQEMLALKVEKISDSKMNYSFNLAEKTDEGTYTYAAVTPAIKAISGNGYRSGKAGNISYALVTSSQTPLADGPDPSTNILVAKYVAGKTQPTAIPFTFKHAVSFGKMTVKNFPALAPDETVEKITIMSPKSQTMSGRLYENIETGALTKFSEGSCKNYVDLLPTNISFNTAGFDVWFTTLPITLSAGDSLTVSVNTNKDNYSFIKVLSKDVNFNKGAISEFTIDYKKCIAVKILTFDFSTCPAGWPGKESYITTGDKKEYTYDYVLNGTTYKFTCAPCSDLAGTSPRKIGWGYDGNNVVSYFVAQSHRFLGLPPIEGYKLVGVKFTQVLAAQKTPRQACITTTITAQKSQAAACVAGGDAKVVNTQNAEFTFNLTSTSANTRYYFAPCSSASAFKTLTLVYNSVE